MFAKPGSQGAAFVQGQYVPIEDAKISVLDWGLTHSDAVYDVVHVWNGRFFRLDDHIERFLASAKGWRLTLDHDRGQIAAILHQCVRRSGLREAYVAMVCTRGRPRVPGQRRPSGAVNQFLAYAIPWQWGFAPEVQERGAHVIIAKTRRIPPESVDPTLKNYHWGDLVRAMYEAEDAGADNAVLLDMDGFVTEGPGFNLFAVRDGVVVSPDRGALEGITRKTVYELCDELGIASRVGRLTADDLYNADEAFAAATAGGIMPVARIDSHILSNDRPGPVSLKLKQLYWAKHDQGWHATAVTYD